MVIDDIPGEPGGGIIPPEEESEGVLLATINYSETAQASNGVSDLTGYTWVGNETIDISNSFTYSLNFISNSNTFTSIKTQSAFGTVLLYDSFSVYSDSVGTWDIPAYQTIQITGGTDATNSTLIQWLQDNGTLTAPQSSNSNDTSVKTFFGSSEISKMLFGSSTISALYFGNTKIYEGTPAPVKCTVNNLGASNPSSVVFTKDADFTNQGLGIEEVTIGNDVFIKIPTMYRKINTVVSNQITSFTIANAKIDNDYKPYPCFLDENGNLLDYVLIGKYYISSTTVANSVKASAEKMAIGIGRTLCQAKTDANYQGLLYDWQIHKLWQDLIICAKQTVDTNTGSGIGTSYTDDFGIYWAAKGSTGGWVDGLTFSNRSYSVSYKPSAYTDNATSSTTDYVSIGYTLQGSFDDGYDTNITKLGYDSNNPFVNMPSNASGYYDFRIYYCDAVACNFSGNHPFASHIHYPLSDDGAFCASFTGSWSTAQLGCRLCLRPKV